MEKIKIAVLLAGCVSILFGYLRFIADEKGNVNLNNYRFTGGLFLVVGGVLEGVRDMGSLTLTKSAVSALAICVGLLLFYVGFSI
jgi:hypothetical protein